MTTNNHPENGPVSLDRLHQISEILSKASAQSDGGNLGYAMADAVKAIDELLEVRKAKPVAWTDEQELRDVEKDGLGYLFTVNPITPHADHRRVIKLYRHAQPEPVVPEILLSAMEEVLRISDRDHESWHKARNGIAASRAAMLQGKAEPVSNRDELNYPVIPDGWISCNERMPKKGQEVLCTDQFENYETALYDTGYIPGPPFFATTAGEFHPTHWMPLPAAPQQEVK